MLYQRIEDVTKARTILLHCIDDLNNALALYKSVRAVANAPAPATALRRSPRLNTPTYKANVLAKKMDAYHQNKELRNYLKYEALKRTLAKNKQAREFYLHPDCQAVMTAERLVHNIIFLDKQKGTKSDTMIYRDLIQKCMILCNQGYERAIAERKPNAHRVRFMQNALKEWDEKMQLCLHNGYIV